MAPPGGPRKALPLLPDDDFFIINGDTLTDVDLGALAKSHRDSGALVTMAVLGDKELVGRYGGVVTDSRGIVHGFVPRGARRPSAITSSACRWRIRRCSRISR